MLAVARALAGNLELLMLDEPSQGLAPRLVHEVQSVMLRLRDEGIALLLESRMREWRWW
jgi:branched-chain amino acid transport system ATP-binding protein